MVKTSRQDALFCFWPVLDLTDALEEMEGEAKCDLCESNEI